ncbi:hypothetical protein GCM10008937_07530 [Deinococcus depolymerans]|uniref:Secreted protein n=1 Tax=Deinococcus depolymerans TaxID=392408 RepID=A0ABN1BRE1_9DEIO
MALARVHEAFTVVVMVRVPVVETARAEPESSRAVVRNCFMRGLLMHLPVRQSVGAMQLRPSVRRGPSHPCHGREDEERVSRILV